MYYIFENREWSCNYCGTKIEDKPTPSTQDYNLGVWREGREAMRMRKEVREEREWREERKRKEGQRRREEREERKREEMGELVLIYFFCVSERV